MSNLSFGVVCLVVTLLPARDLRAEWPELLHVQPVAMQPATEPATDSSALPATLVPGDDASRVPGLPLDSPPTDLAAEPDINQPGPDMGDYPNSAFTLPRGRMQFETGPLTFRTRNARNSSAYASPFLFRYGVTDDVEFRVLGTGITSFLSPEFTTGFGVLTFDTKIHLWDARMGHYIPAVAFEASLQTELGSPAFRGGTQPGLNINMDFPFTEQTNFETTVGYSGSLTDTQLVTRQENLSVVVQVPRNEYIFSVQSAIEHQVTETLTLFVHDYYWTPIGVSGKPGLIVGAGFFYQLSRRAMLFGSANAGLTDVPAPFLTQLGIAYAF